MVGGLLFSKFVTILLDRIQSEQHLEYHKSKVEQSDLILEDEYDQYIEGNQTRPELSCQFL